MRSINLNFRLLLMVTMLVFLCGYAGAQVCNGSLGDPVVNIDFGRGSSNFGFSLGSTTNYNFVTGRSPNGEGDYAIVKTTNGLNQGWYPIFNRTSNDFDGYMMIINAAQSPGFFYESADFIELCPNTTYEFAAWVFNLLRNPNGIQPNITFQILSENDQTLGTYDTGNLSNADPNWRQYGFQFRTTSASRVKIRMINNGLGGNGNDIALDDITFRACGPQITAGIGNSSNTAENICERSNATFPLTATVMGSPNLLYQWQRSLGNGWVDVPGATTTSTTVVFNNAIPGKYEYRLTVGEPLNFGSVSCRTVSPTLTINVNTYPTPQALSNGIVCTGDQIILDVAGATGIYEWKNPAGIVFSQEKSPVISNATSAMAGTYTVNINSLGCLTSSTVDVVIIPPPVASVATNALFICEGESTVLNALGGSAYTYTWSPSTGLSATNIANPIASPTRNTTYTVSISNGSCSRTAQVNITVYRVPVANAGEDKKILLGKNVMLDGEYEGERTSYYWTPTTGLDDPRKLNPIASPTANTTYTLNVVSALGCAAATDEVFVRVFEKVVVPGSFSPNGDGVNDLWNITAIETYAKPKVSVMNRYGEVLFESTNYNEKPWNGKYKNADVPVGVYYYVITLDDDTKPLSGSLTVIR